MLFFYVIYVLFLLQFGEIYCSFCGFLMYNAVYRIDERAVDEVVSSTFTNWCLCFTPSLYGNSKTFVIAYFRSINYQKFDLS